MPITRMYAASWGLYRAPLSDVITLEDIREVAKLSLSSTGRPFCTSHRRLEILQESLAFVAGYRIKCYLISQDINQLKSRETGYGLDETITSNCHVQTSPR